jgi:diguanylate cyclase (GGDEF)-like protein
VAADSLGRVAADVHDLRVPVGDAENLLVMALKRRSPVAIVHRTRDSLLEVIGGPLEAGAWAEGNGSTPGGAVRAAIMAVPLIAREEVVGVIAVSRSEPPLIRRHEIELLLLYANTAGLTVERAELYARMHRSLEQLEVTDHVSHLHTLSFGSRRAAEEIARCAAAGKPFAGIVLGLDGFAGYNDRCGRELGDRCLGELGDLVKGALRGDDVAFRYGGRLLAVILPGAGRDQVSAVAERIREGVRRHRFAGRDGRRDEQLTVSLGCGLWAAGAPAGSDVFEVLLAHLRRAEAAGGNVAFTAEG